MTGRTRRNRRLIRMVWLGLACTLPMLALAPGASAAPLTATRTTLNVDASGQASVTVAGIDDQPASGVVNFVEDGRILAQALLNSGGQATTHLALLPGEQDLRAFYVGDATHQSSSSLLDTVHPETGGSSTPSFQLSIAPVSPSSLPLTLTAGQSGSLTVTVTPVNNNQLTAPMFVTLSCSGLPSLSSCAFTPENIEILPTTPTSCTSGSPASACPPTSLMVVSTQAAVTAGSSTSSVRRSSTADWALLLPGIFGLGGIAFGTRRRRWLQRLSLIALVGVVTMLGTTGCNPQYYYYHHGPILAPGTPAGSYTVTITAQSSNGVVSTSNSTTMALTVQ